MPYCTNCGREIGTDYDFCPECGTRVVSEEEIEYSYYEHEAMKPCPKCGELMPADSLYCLNCGELFNLDDDDFSQIQYKIQHMFGDWKNKWVALTLCILFGWMGAHKYYEGKKFMGLLYTFTLGFLFVGWIIDIILLIKKPNPYLAKH